MISSKKRFRPTNLRSSRHVQEETQRNPALSTATPEPSIEHDGVGSHVPDETLSINFLHPSELSVTSNSITDLIIPQNIQQPQNNLFTPTHFSPPHGDVPFGPTTNFSDYSPHTNTDVTNLSSHSPHTNTDVTNFSSHSPHTNADVTNFDTHSPNTSTDVTNFDTHSPHTNTDVTIFDTHSPRTSTGVTNLDAHSPHTNTDVTIFDTHSPHTNTGVTNSFNSLSPHRSTDISIMRAESQLSDEEVTIEEEGDDYSQNPRLKEIKARLKAARKREDAQLMKLLSRPELFDPDRPLNRDSLTMSELIRLSSIKLRDRNAGKKCPDVSQTPLPTKIQRQTSQDDDHPVQQRRSMQVKLVNDNLVVDEESMVLPTKRQDTSAESDEVVYEFGVEGQAFKRRQKRDYRVRKWSESENNVFLQALSQYGTDFSIIQTALLPHRTRREIKCKFKREEKLHPNRVNRALSRRISVMEYIYIDDLEKQDRYVKRESEP